MGMSEFMAQAVSLARDMMEGEIAPPSLVVALPDKGPPVPLFIEMDQVDVRMEVLHASIDKFVKSTGARKWLQVLEARMWAPADKRAKDIFVCHVHDGKMFRGQLLSAIRGENGEIKSLRLPGPETKTLRAA